MSLIETSNTKDILKKESPWGAPNKSNKQPSSNNSDDMEDLAKKLQITNQLRLALALNLSIFFNEIMNDSNSACKITQETLDIASKAFGNTDEEDEEFIDAFRILDTMKENLQIWGNFEPKHE